MKKSLQLTILLFTASLFSASAAMIPDSIGVKKSGGESFIIHKIENSEGWYAIARIYGVSYTDLRLANKDSSDKLIPGNTILVPLARLKNKDPHFEKNYTQVSDDFFYTVKEGETLFGIARKFQISADSIKLWNHLETGALKYGQKLKVGYKSKQPVLEPENPEIKNIKKTIVAVSDTSSKIKKDAVAPDSKNPKVILSTKPNTVEPVKKTAPITVKTEKSSTAISVDSTRIIKTAAVVNVKTDPKKSVSSGTAKGRKEFNETGVASWIGDDDINPNKYYALHRSAPIGTIIRVTNKMNSKYVFVKVVGLLPATGDNTDLVIKISKASAEKLGVRDSRFQSELNYGVIEKP